MKIIKSIIIILSVFLITSCDYQEINNLAIVDAIGIDYKDNLYEVNLEILESDDKTYNITSKANTLIEAISMCNNKIDKKITFENVKVMLISHALAQDGINKIADLMIRDNQITTNFNLLITDDINILNDNKKGTFLSKLLIYSYNNKDHFDNDIAQIKDNKKALVIPIVKEDKINSLGVFKEDKLIYEIKENDIPYYKILNGYPSLVNTPNISLNIYHNTKINNKYYLKGKIIEVKDNNNFKENNYIKNKEQEVSNVISERLNNLIKESNNYNIKLIDNNSIEVQVSINRIGALFKNI